MSIIKDFLSQWDDWEDFRESLIEGITERANRRGTKRLFVLKAGSMQRKIPKAALPIEKGSLETHCAYAYIAKNEQELYEKVAKSLEKKLKAYKKNPDKPMEEIDYNSFQSYKNLTSSNQPRIGEMLGKNLLGEINEKISQKQIDVELFETIIKQLKRFSVSARERKQTAKYGFEQDLKGVKYGIELAKKYGELKYAFAPDGKVRFCEYNENWYKHKDDEKLSPERLKLINKMNKTN